MPQGRQAPSHDATQCPLPMQLLERGALLCLLQVRRISESQPQRVRLAVDKWLRGVDLALQGGEPQQPSRPLGGRQHRAGASDTSGGGSGTTGAARTQAQADAAMQALLVVY